MLFNSKTDIRFELSVKINGCLSNAKLAQHGDEVAPER